jgi:hypothetical protein
VKPQPYPDANASPRLRDVPQLWAGLLLIAVAWPLNWSLPGLRTHLLFFPLWLGYSLAVDGLVYLRRGTSLLRRSPRAYAGLFLASAPVWWLFEAINVRTENWAYPGQELVPPLWNALLKTLSFSTVVPAVFGTAELVGTWRPLQRLRRGPVVPPTRRVLLALLLLGLTMFLLLLIWPGVFFPFTWISLYFIIAATNGLLGFRTLGTYTARGDWHPPLALMLGTLVCGFFWEFWNYWGYPRWEYSVAPFEFLYIFEMPLLGYGGYLPFGLELFALYHLLVGLLGLQHLTDYVQFDRVLDRHRGG